MYPDAINWPIDRLRFGWIGLETAIFNLSASLASFVPSCYTLWLVHQGTGAIIVDGRPLSIRKSHCLLFTPGTRVEFVHSPGQMLHVYALSFEVHADTGAAPEDDVLALSSNRAVSVHPLPKFIAMMDALGDFGPACAGLDKFKRSIALQELLYHFLVQAFAEQPVNSKEAVEQTIAYMQEHYKRPLKLSDLSVMACLGVRQYCHVFKQVTGASPMDYLYRLRIEQAKKLLRVSSLDMLSVANQVGFKDEFYFSRRFKQQEGVAPSVYVKNRRPRVIGLLYTSHLLALGITPVGAPDYHLFRNEYVQSYLPAIQSFGWSPCDMEAIRRLEPDLILGYEHLTPGEYEQFSQIAEVVRIPWQSQDVYQQLDSVSVALDMRHMCRDWLDRHQEKAARKRERLCAVIGSRETCAAFVIEDGSFRVAGDRNIGHVLYRALQLAPHPLVQQHIDDYYGVNVYSDPLPFPELGRYDADRLFIMVDSRDDRAEAAFRKLRQTEQWRSLTAVRQGRIHILPYDRWWMYSPLAVDGQLDDVTERMVPIY